MTRRWLFGALLVGVGLWLLLAAPATWPGEPVQQPARPDCPVWMCPAHYTWEA